VGDENIKNGVDIRDHIGLVHHMLKKYNIFKNNPYYDDYISEAFYVLFKAWNTYTGETKFSNYACYCIDNAIRFIYRKTTYRECHVDSLEFGLTDGDGDKMRTRQERYVSKVTNYDDIDALLDLENAAKQIRLSPTESKVIDIILNNTELTQNEIAEIIKTSQANVSRALSSIKHKLKIKTRVIV
jgi:RNA polymerase sigma factor (sigma-70 family)